MHVAGCVGVRRKSGCEGSRARAKDQHQQRRASHFNLAVVPGLGGEVGTVQTRAPLPRCGVLGILGLKAKGGAEGDGFMH